MRWKDAEPRDGMISGDPVLREHTGMGFGAPGEGWPALMALESPRPSGASSQVSYSKILRGQGNPLLPTTGHTLHHISTLSHYKMHYILNSPSE